MQWCSFKFVLDVKIRFWFQEQFNACGMFDSVQLQRYQMTKVLFSKWFYHQVCDKQFYKVWIDQLGLLINADPYLSSYHFYLDAQSHLLIFQFPLPIFNLPNIERKPGANQSCRIYQNMFRVSELLSVKMFEIQEKCSMCCH